MNAAAPIEPVYQLDPDAILYPVSEHGVLQRLGSEDIAVLEPTASLVALNCFAAPTTFENAKACFMARYPELLRAQHSEKVIQEKFDFVVGYALKLGVLKSPKDVIEGPTHNHRARTFLTTITLVAEDLVTDLATMEEFGEHAVASETGETLDNIFRRALGELTRIATALSRQRHIYIKRQLEGLKLSDRLHLGAGGANLAGWINVDISRADLRLNLTWGLPFPDRTFKYVFLSHLFEHLYKQRDAPKVLSEIIRVLQPGGIVRLIVPNAETYMRAYIERDDEFFAMQRRVWFTWAPKARTKLEAILGYLGAPESPPAGMAQHKYAYDFETLKLMLSDAGFREVRQCSYMSSLHQELMVDDTSYVADANANGKYASLFVEAIR